MDSMSNFMQFLPKQMNTKIKQKCVVYFILATLMKNVLSQWCKRSACWKATQFPSPYFYIDEYYILVV